jgi:hypothetical protein
LTPQLSGGTIRFVLEYAGITAAIAILVSSLNGVVGSALPSSDLKAAALVTAAAQSHHVSGSQARAAYAKAAFPKPALRYLYAVGWIGSASAPAACKAAQVLGPDPSVAAAQALRGSPRVLGLLRAAHVTVNQAAAAIGRGTTDGCP